MSFSVLMLIPFGVVVGVGVLFMWLVARQARRIPVGPHSAGVVPEIAGACVSGPLRSIGGSHPCRWIAVKSRNLSTVQRALGLSNPVPCSWSEGMVQTHERRLFLSPPMNGWILIVGHQLPDPGDDVDACFRFLNRISRDLGEVQYFSTNRVLGHHAWARFDNGQCFRGYAWNGEVLWNHGPMTWAERKLGMRCLNYLEPLEGAAFEALDFGRSNNEKIQLLASIWSLDPASIDSRAEPEVLGVAGDLARLG